MHAKCQFSSIGHTDFNSNSHIRPPVRLATLPIDPPLDDPGVTENRRRIIRAFSVVFPHISPIFRRILNAAPTAIRRLSLRLSDTKQFRSGRKFRAGIRRSSIRNIRAGIRRHSIRAGKHARQSIRRLRRHGSSLRKYLRVWHTMNGTFCGNGIDECQCCCCCCCRIHGICSSWQSTFISGGTSSICFR